MFGKRELHEDAVDLGVGVEVGDDLSGMMRNGGRLERDILLRFFFLFLLSGALALAPLLGGKKGNRLFCPERQFFFRSRTPAYPPKAQSGKETGKPSLVGGARAEI